MKVHPQDVVVVAVANPSELPHCKYPETCDRTRVCEHFRLTTVGGMSGIGCGSGSIVHTWPERVIDQ